ncbi:MAG: hypothetical protein H6Q57_1933, partial [Geobacteraceae bacterium]|jgi:S-methylmethionine-dependent homocysteine/selenocysteine methylase|nr:hypothetical protein [Geobacteraceae bacterium]
MYIYETTCHIISGVRTLGEASYDKALDRHLRKMGKDSWELVSVQKATQILSVDPHTVNLTDEQMSNYASPREVFVFFWKKKIEPPSDED